MAQNHLYRSYKKDNSSPMFITIAAALQILIIVYYIVVGSGKITLPGAIQKPT